MRTEMSVAAAPDGGSPSPLNDNKANHHCPANSQYQNSTHNNTAGSQPTNSGGQRRQNSTALSSSTESGPVAVFTPCSNSHPFDERCITVTCGEAHPIKIGRAVVRVHPALNNAIFDCKVLSRNHAVMWYHNGQFLIKDTRSSNGTFINNERLSNSGEDSEAWPLYSGDILQLGVEIVDNAKKVASGCVTCIVTLRNERGEECLRPSSAESSAAAAAATLAANGGAAAASSDQSVASIERMLIDNESFALKYTLVPNGKLFIMNQYLKEARFRENALGAKLQSLEEQLAASQEALESSWQALMNEEHLLSRIEILESQLALYAAATKPSATAAGGQSIKATKRSVVGVAPSQNGSDLANGATEPAKENGLASCDEITMRIEESGASMAPPKSAKIWQLSDELIRSEIQKIYEDRTKAELAAKDALRKAEEEVIESTMRLHDVENSLLNLESENTLLRRQCDDYEAELQRQRATLEETLADVGRMHEERVKQADELYKVHDEVFQLRDQIVQKAAENEQLTHQISLLLEEAAELTAKTEAEKKEQQAAESAAGVSTVDGEPPAEVSVLKLADVSQQSAISSDEHDESAKPLESENNEPKEEIDQIVSTVATQREDEPAEEEEGQDEEKEEDYNIQSHDTSSLISDVSVGRCTCGRVFPAAHLAEDPYAEKFPKPVSRLSASANIQVLLFSALPFLAVLFALIFPLYYLWPSTDDGGCIAPSTVADDDGTSANDAVGNGTSPSSTSAV